MSLSQFRLRGKFGTRNNSNCAPRVLILLPMYLQAVFYHYFDHKLPFNDAVFLLANNLHYKRIRIDCSSITLVNLLIFLVNNYINSFY
jgi:hypothetical protein